MADYWIKFYLDILDDPKMATLPDRLWRRVAELFLVAKRVNKDGELPDTSQIAWILRMPADALEDDLRKIEMTGIIQRTENGWMVVNFAKRQAASTNTERSKAFREKQQHNQYNETRNERGENVSLHRNRQQTTEAESEAELEQIQRETQSLSLDIFDLYQTVFGKRAPQILMAELKSIESEFPADWLADAFKETAKNNGKSWKYTRQILNNWKSQGHKNNNNHNQSSDVLVIDPFNPRKPMAR